MPAAALPAGTAGELTLARELTLAQALCFRFSGQFVLLQTTGGVRCCIVLSFSGQLALLSGLGKWYQMLQLSDSPLLIQIPAEYMASGH